MSPLFDVRLSGLTRSGQNSLMFSFLVCEELVLILLKILEKLLQQSSVFLSFSVWGGFDY